MTESFNDDIFKTWIESQKRIWENLSTVLPSLPSSEGMGTWRQAYLENLATWEAAVKQTLKAEATWVEQWSRQLNKTEPVPQPLSEWTHQMEKVMQHWINIQDRLWEDCFSLLREASQVTQPVSSKPLTAAKSKEMTSQSPAAAASIPQSATTTPAKDDLKTINGIGPVLEQRLNAQGITSYRQIATLTSEDINRIEISVTKMAGRVQREHWIEQAREQHLRKYKEAL